MEEQGPIDEYPNGLALQEVGNDETSGHGSVDVSAAAVFGAFAVLGAWLFILFMLVMGVVMLVSGM